MYDFKWNCRDRHGVTTIKSKTLTLGGNKSNFSTKKRSSGWLYLKSGTKATINSNCVVKNVMNNKEEDGGSAICTFGTLILNGTIENCEGSDGVYHWSEERKCNNK